MAPGARTASSRQRLVPKPLHDKALGTAASWKGCVVGGVTSAPPPPPHRAGRGVSGTAAEMFPTRPEDAGRGCRLPRTTLLPIRAAISADAAVFQRSLTWAALE